MKIDIHSHILPKKWPDLKQVTRTLTIRYKGSITFISICVFHRALSQTVVGLKTSFWIGFFLVELQIRYESMFSISE